MAGGFSSGFSSGFDIAASSTVTPFTAVLGVTGFAPTVTVCTARSATAYTIQFRRGTEGCWTGVNPVLSEGEPGLETDTGLIKIGDGSTAWSSLPYDAVKLPPTFTAGSVLFVGATDVISQDNAGISFNSTTDTLSVGAAVLSAGTTTRAPITFTSGTLLTTPVSGAMEFDGSSLYFTQAGVRRYVTLGNDIRVSSSTVTNTVTETTIHTSAIAIDELKVGKMYKLTLLGKTTTANASQFFTLRHKMGGTTLIATTMAAKAVTDDHFRAESYITIRTIGVSGTYAVHLEGAIGDQVITDTPVTGTVDTTVAEDMTATIQWDAANAGNVFTIMQAVLEVIG